MPERLVLSASPATRYASGAIMYFAQGIPAGLLSIALPAWLASQGVGAGQIATYLAVVSLPWALKLFTGPLMDRFQFPAMGRRRPWVLGAQLGLTLTLLALALVRDPVADIGLLMLLGVLVNIFAATQDVAVDGMSIDVTPVQEQGRLNAFMAFGKAVGWGSSSAVSGVLLVTLGLPLTAGLAAAVSAAILLGFSRVRERPGERLLPWSAGQAQGEARRRLSFTDLLRDIRAVLWSRSGIVLLCILLFDGLVSGYGHALMPIAAIKLFGYTTPEWSRLVALMGLVGAAGALALGPLIDRVGARRVLLITAAVVTLHAVLLGATQGLWQNTAYVRAMLSAWVLLGPMGMVCVIALAMAHCGSESSATQFAVYMSTANLGGSAGSKLYGMVAEGVSYTEAYLLLGGLAAAMIAVIAIFRHAPPRAADTRAGRPAPQYTAGQGAGEAGIFWSGAMRCPKCRRDMRMVCHDGVEIDRCDACHGLWFDPGELEKLRSTSAAAAVDTGARSAGREHDTIHDYPCPRCGGTMVRMLEVAATDIWFEQCSRCHGNYLDAGELSALTRGSAADLLGRFRGRGD